MLTELIVIILQNVQILNRYFVYLKLIQCYINYSSIFRKRGTSLCFPLYPIKMVKYIEKKRMFPSAQAARKILGHNELIASLKIKTKLFFGS